MSAYCPIVTPSLWKAEVASTLRLAHSISTNQLPLQSQQVIRTVEVIIEVLVLSRWWKSLCFVSFEICPSDWMNKCAIEGLSGKRG